jgi:hypothetical protein
MSGGCTSKTYKGDVLKMNQVNQVAVVMDNQTKYTAYFPKQMLFCLNVSMCLFHLAFMTVTLTVGKLDLTVPLYRTTITFIRNNQTENSTIPAFELLPEYTKFGSLYLTVVTASFFFCSALAHGGNATLWRKFYEYELTLCRVTTRWIEYFFSASIMVLVIAYNAGIREYLLLIGITMLIASTMPFGLLTEIYARPLTATQWCQPLGIRLIFHLLGYIPQLSAWILILLNFYGETTTEPPAFVYGIIWGQLVLFFSFGFVQLYQIFSEPQDYYKGEIAYQLLSLISKGVLGLLLLSNVLILGSFEELFA